MRYREIIAERRIELDPNHQMTVWENPSSVELRRVLDQFGEARGGSGPGMPLYIWDAHTWVHHTVQKYVGHLPYYLYFSKKRAVQAEEWQKLMKRLGDIWVGVKFSVMDNERNREVPHPEIPLNYSPIARAIGVPLHTTASPVR
jgi:hypothetical protein